MKILFLHGWQSLPGGVKPSYLARHGHQVLTPALDDHDFTAAVATAQAVFEWARCGESPAHAVGPAGLNSQRLAR
ncbi:hypothetical protein TVNIR_2455 [Thioalkalivibrio nitratireducens DSM 14787]|uniref:Uncharacterized protein n=1 Tax=Thioalkalivibrio nitratireducens (strain DSM 14787 / UNIQEM 213 / ALEN2) TaxID=1255043 RepID=L0DWX1_THIND|nr:hypothetical protein [Thioalkalivibrio nitratireducens]AGA34099.1 hypothetical protein TVNIR_2455 [Thioalkalivibrio nitratireducens DSM 14787]